MDVRATLEQGKRGRRPSWRCPSISRSQGTTTALTPRLSLAGDVARQGGARRGRRRRRARRRPARRGGSSRGRPRRTRSSPTSRCRASRPSTTGRCAGARSGDVAARRPARGRARHGRARRSTISRSATSPAVRRPSTPRSTGTPSTRSTRIAEQDGYAEAKAHIGSRWGEALVPVARLRRRPREVTLDGEELPRGGAPAVRVARSSRSSTGASTATPASTVDPAAQTMKPNGTLSL